MKKFNYNQCGKYFAKGFKLKVVHIQNVHEIDKNCSWKKLWIQLWSLWQKFHQKYFAKGFKLKVHIQNVHEIEKIRYESMNDIMEMINTFRNLQNSNVKFVKKKLLKNKFLKCILKMSIKNLKNTTVMSVQKFHTKYWIERTYYSCSWRKRFNCDQCGKNFARGCYLKFNFEFNCDYCGKFLPKPCI